MRLAFYMCPTTANRRPQTLGGATPPSAYWRNPFSRRALFRAVHAILNQS